MGLLLQGNGTGALSHPGTVHTPLNVLTGARTQPSGGGWAAPGTPPASEAIAVLLATGFYSGWGALRAAPLWGRAGAPAQSTTADRGSRFVYTSLAVICINLLRSEPGPPRRRDVGGPEWGAPGCFPIPGCHPRNCMFLPRCLCSAVLPPSPFSASFVNVPNAAEATATQ